MALGPLLVVPGETRHASFSIRQCGDGAIEVRIETTNGTAVSHYLRAEHAELVGQAFIQLGRLKAPEGR